ncbi:MAG TPA: alpha/beta hydrolase [Bacteroidia bacterium]|nr:alpha/beta hydrolase [Bacteroidia bacterium]MCW5920486.1 alpha/beta hydrolase [Bacteroidota bacterium]HMW10553.1 alpha/beta hydrolase [Bacteroidia bacterium]HMY63513.1 alpha/beta hydrolase [Bacteroidia bacterium]HNB11583.1 alpha/beta hydrolase [Bacteroidia bacterium]
MKRRITYIVLTILALTACNENKKEATNNSMTTSVTEKATMKSGFSEVNGIKMYYEIYGQGKPLFLLHGGGSTIQTTFGRVIPLFSKDRQLICVELQAHGRTGDRNTPISFEQDADDVAALLKNLNVHKADIFGFSNGGNTALQVAIRHPEVCNKVVAGSVLLKRNGTFPQFWEFMKNGTFDQMPQQYKDAFIKVNPDSTKLITMYQKCADRVINLKDFTDEQIKSIKAPVLLINGDQDVATAEHIVAMSKLIPNCKLAIIPGGHGAYIGEITTLNADYKESEFIIPLIEKFLDEKTKQ